MADSVTVLARDAVEPLVLSIDVGTSSARALAYDARGERVSGVEARRPYAVQTTPEGGVVIDPDKLFELVAECVDEAYASLVDLRRTVRAVAFDTFWHSLMGLDADRNPLTPVLTWADTRSGEAAASLRSSLDEREVHARTGCYLHSSYPTAKLRWLRETQPDLFEQTRHWMSFSEYAYLRIFGTVRASVSMASGTGLFDQHRCIWDAPILEALQVREDQLSPLADLSEPMIGTSEPYARRWSALARVPWYLAVGDGATSNIGSGGVTEDRVVVMVGTSGAMRVVREAEHFDVPEGLWSYRVDGRRIVQGGALSEGGNVFAWLVRTLQLEQGDALEKALVEMNADDHGLTVLPFLAGERSPNWNVNAISALLGITLDTTPVELVRAYLEAITYRFGFVYDILQRTLPAARYMIGSGAGLTHSPAWMQMTADVLDRPLHASAALEASCRGAALLALENMGALSDLSDLPPPLADSYEPSPERTARYRKAMERQRMYYERILG